jgi:hypothetical protein
LSPGLTRTRQERILLVSAVHSYLRCVFVHMLSLPNLIKHCCAVSRRLRNPDNGWTFCSPDNLRTYQRHCHRHRHPSIAHLMQPVSSPPWSDLDSFTTGYCRDTSERNIPLLHRRPVAVPFGVCVHQAPAFVNYESETHCVLSSGLLYIVASLSSLILDSVELQFMKPSWWLKSALGFRQKASS